MLRDVVTESSSPLSSAERHEFEALRKELGDARREQAESLGRTPDAERILRRATTLLEERVASGGALQVEQVQSLAMWSVLGGLLGARLFHVADRWDVYAANPIQVLNLWEGGMAVYGGLIGGFLVALAYAIRVGLPVWKLADAAAPGMLLGQAVGRLACIPNGDAVGAPANVPWAFIYTNPAALVPHEWLGVPLHPYPVYELLFDVALLAALWRLRGARIPAGMLFLLYVVGYSIGRFLLTFYRVEQVWFWGLQEAQVISLLTLALALPFLVWRMWFSGSPGALHRPVPVPATPTPSTGSGR